MESVSEKTFSYRYPYLEIYTCINKWIDDLENQKKTISQIERGDVANLNITINKVIFNKFYPK